MALKKSNRKRNTIVNKEEMDEKFYCKVSLRFKATLSRIFHFRIKSRLDGGSKVRLVACS